MKLSTRSRYGMKAMYELALNYKNGPVSIKTISENIDVSGKYLHALLTILKSGGLVRSVWGSHGGFVLSSSPAKINIYDIVKTLEGPISVVECVANSRLCHRSKNCVTREIWIDISDAIENTLSDITLNDMLQK
ncbi:MAG: Rrf2 family transcriptional regulator, partial [Spirochaetes bacterium]|nr:Rrf2 family transcriptional regulator [Spirochaetota bacterium]